LTIFTRLNPELTAQGYVTKTFATCAYSNVAYRHSLKIILVSDCHRSRSIIALS